MERLTEIMTDLERVSNLIADAIIRRTNPCEDDITESAARKLYGDRWLRQMKKCGLAKWSRVGSRNIYSRHQLDCLRDAEREEAKLIFKRLGKE